MSILILGHGQHGKDTAAEILSDETNLTFISSSYAALDCIYPVISQARGIKDKNELFLDRYNCRQLWKEAISLLNYPDKSTLCREILSKYHIYVGLRCDEEFEACRHLFDHILWVDGRNRVMTTDSTMKIDYDPKIMYFIDNNFGVRKLRNQLIKFAKYAGYIS
jgi:hypothetical protein